MIAPREIMDRAAIAGAGTLAQRRRDIKGTRSIRRHKKCIDISSEERTPDQMIESLGFKHCGSASNVMKTVFMIIGHEDHFILALCSCYASAEAPRSARALVCFSFL